MTPEKMIESLIGKYRIRKDDFEREAKTPSSKTCRELMLFGAFTAGTVVSDLIKLRDCLAAKEDEADA